MRPTRMPTKTAGFRIFRRRAHCKLERRKAEKAKHQRQNGERHQDRAEFVRRQIGGCRDLPETAREMPARCR